MKVILFGATGMVGQGVLRECLLSSDVEVVESVGRSATGSEHPKIREILRRDFSNFEPIADALTGFDACFYCLGISSSGISNEEYERITYGYTMAAAELLARRNPQMTFVYVSGAGTDSTERGRSNWARVKGRTENALLRLTFKAAYMFRPGFIEPLHGIQSKTALYRRLYTLMKPIAPILRRAFPESILTTEQIGRAMLAVAKHGAPKPILEAKDIRRLAQ